MPLTPIVTVPGVDFAHRDEAYVMWQHGDFGMAAVRAMAAASPRLLRLYPEGMYSLLIIEPHTSPPSPEVREAITRQMAGAQPRAIAVAMEQQGFRGALVRGVMTGLKFAARVRHPMQIFATVDDAIWWLGEQRGAGPDWARTLRADVAAWRDKRRPQLPMHPG